MKRSYRVKEMPRSALTEKSRRSRACVSGTVDDQNMQLAPAWTQKFKFSSIFIQLEHLIRMRIASTSCKCIIATDLYSEVPEQHKNVPQP